MLVEGDFACEYDPLGRFYLYVVEEASPASAINVASILANAPVPLGFDPICKTDATQPQCIRHFWADLVGNPEAAYTFWYGLGPWAMNGVITASVFAPTCYEAGFMGFDARALQNCQEKYGASP